MDVVEADLLAAIAADPDAAEPRVIYADWLQAEDDPRGELIVVQAARLERPTDSQLQERERELTKQLAEKLLEGTVEKPLSSDLITRWYLGCVDAMSINARTAKLLRSTHSRWFTRPEFTVVRELDLKSKYARTLRVVTEPLQRTVRRLSFGDSYSTFDQATLAAITKRLPNLTGLHLRCTDVPDLRTLAPLKLTELSLELHAISDAGITRILEAQWPLEKFSLRLTMAPDDYLHGPLAQLFNGTFLGTVKHFLVGANAPILDIIEWLAVSKRAETVESLTLNLYGTNAEQQRRVERYRDALAKMRFVPLLQTNVGYNTEYWDAENCTNVGSFLNYRLDRAADSLACYEQALRIKPEHSVARHNLGIALRKLKRFEESLVAFDTVIAQSRAPTASLFNGRHYTLCELGRRDEARADLERAVQLDANFADAWNNLGVERQHVGDVDGSLKAFRRCTEIAPLHGYSRRNEADLLLEVGRAAHALPIYRDLLRETPGHGPTMAMLAHAQLETNDLHGARITLDARIADPTEDNLNRLYVLRGLARQATGDRAGATSDFDACAQRTECPGWFAVSVFARTISDRTLWARVVPDTAVTPRQITDAIVTHATATRGARATKFHDATVDDQLDCAEIAFVAALVAKQRPLAVQRARALANLYVEQGPRFSRKWFQVLSTTVVIGTRALDARTRDLIALVLRAVRGRRRIADVLAIDN